LKVYEIRLANMSGLLPVQVYSFGPNIGRQVAADDSCVPMKTPARLLRSRPWSQPACSNASQVQVNSIRTCGSMELASCTDTPNMRLSNR
jgi:hypothetical protein